MLDSEFWAEKNICCHVWNSLFKISHTLFLLYNTMQYKIASAAKFQLLVKCFGIHKILNFQLVLQGSSSRPFCMKYSHPIGVNHALSNVYTRFVGPE